ncbi:MAG: hypothetical protein EOP06_02245 [Proteobacteria bacterium]|nr:MAG: hypothetical protein EOP06_02245 [Pseudomonadota bacterium]
MIKRVSRRDFIRNSGGTLLSLPLVNLLATGCTDGYQPTKNNLEAAPSLGDSSPSDLFKVEIPSPITYDFEGVSFSLLDPGSGRSTTQTSKTPEQIFGTYSTALSSPVSTYFVSLTGSDANNGLTLATPFQSPKKAVTAGNLTGAAYKVIVSGGDYSRSLIGMSPTQDSAWIANGVVTMGAFDPASSYAFTVDTTYTSTYKMARPSVNRVVDRKGVDSFGDPIELTYVPTAAICNVTPGTWSDDGGVVSLYVHRSDGQAPTFVNTRYFVKDVSIFSLNSAVNLYVGNDDGVSNFILEGGASNFRALPQTTAKRIVVGKNILSRFTGGKVNPTGNGMSSDSFWGSMWLFNCTSNHNMNDGFNLHNFSNVAECYLVTVNCSGHNNGVGPSISQVSCNGWTNHDVSFGADFSGYYIGNRGGTIRSVNACSAFFAGTLVKDDFGDLMNGGVMSPTAFRTDNTVIFWCYRTKVDMPSHTAGYLAASGSKIFMRDICPTAAAIGGNGTIERW